MVLEAESLIKIGDPEKGFTRYFSKDDLTGKIYEFQLSRTPNFTGNLQAYRDGYIAQGINAVVDFNPVLGNAHKGVWTEAASNMAEFMKGAQ